MKLLDEIIQKRLELKKAGVEVSSIAASKGDESVEVHFIREQKRPEYQPAVVTTEEGDENNDDELDYYHES